MKAIVCDVCGAVVKPYHSDIISVGDGTIDFEVCPKCRDEIKEFVFALRKQKGGDNEQICI